MASVRGRRLKEPVIVINDNNYIEGIDGGRRRNPRSGQRGCNVRMRSAAVGPGVSVCNRGGTRAPRFVSSPGQREWRQLPVHTRVSLCTTYVNTRNEEHALRATQASWIMHGTCRWCVEGRIFGCQDPIADRRLKNAPANWLSAP